MNYFRCCFIFFLSGVSFAGSAHTSFMYEIKGEIKRLKNDTLYLSIMSGNEGNLPERILIPCSNDKFSYKSQANQTAIVWAQTTTKKSNNGKFTFFIEKGGIKIRGNNIDLSQTTIEGTAKNKEYSYEQDRMNNYYDRLKPFQLRLKESGDSSTAAYKEVYRQIAKLYDSVFLFQKEFVSTHPNSLVSCMLLPLIADKIPVQKLEGYYINLAEDVKQLSMLAKMPGRIAAKKRSVIGSSAPDCIINDMNGKPVKISDYNGKYVLLDFWDSWSVPCRKDNPYVKGAYEEFKDKNFVIIGVSEDEDGNKWKQAIEKDHLPWIHISDFQKTNKVAELYGVQPIPDNFLINPEGKIIERGAYMVKI